MKKLLYKEMKLSANPLSYWFIAFSAMTMIPRYPILVGSFFICLGIFYTYQQIREYDDITYTVMLPVKKKDVVTAKYLFVLFIEFIVIRRFISEQITLITADKSENVFPTFHKFIELTHLYASYSSLCKRIIPIHNKSDVTE